MIRRLCLVVLVVASAGCGDGAAVQELSVSTAPATSTSIVVPFVCPAPILVDDPSDVVGALAAVEWRGLGGYSSGAVPMTPDLEVSGTVVVSAAVVPVPVSCRERSDCHDGASFVMSVPIPGVKLGGTAGADFQPGAATLTLTDTTVRLRPVLRDTHPGPYNAIPVVIVEQSCAMPCPTGTEKCPVDGACYALGDLFCRLCEGRSAAECACRQPEGGALVDGEECDFQVSGDVICAGECRFGVCVSDGC